MRVCVCICVCVYACVHVRECLSQSLAVSYLSVVGRWSGEAGIRWRAGLGIRWRAGLGGRWFAEAGWGAGLASAP